MSSQAGGFPKQDFETEMFHAMCTLQDDSRERLQQLESEKKVK